MTDMDIVEGSPSNSSPKVSYKESLLIPKGPAVENLDLDLSNVMEDDPNPEDRWYKDEELPSRDEKDFDPCPTILVSKEEYGDWCKPWRAALIVKGGGDQLERGNAGSKGIANIRESPPKMESFNANINGNDSGSRFDSLNNFDSDVEEIMHESVTHIEPQHSEHMHNGPIVAEPKKPQKKSCLCQSNSEKILKPGAGKNSQTHKKGPSKFGSLPTNRNPKGKNKNPIHLVAPTEKTTEVTNVASSSRNDEVLLRDQAILQEMRRINQEQALAFEASKMAKKNFESFAVTNSFLTQNPLYLHNGADSNTVGGGDTVKEKPPDMKIGAQESKASTKLQVSIDQNNGAAREGSQS
ncbi:hypothetical protein PIB30_086635 [Stylosanthes scabra]|uniref:Uncharacterized protein n=1 Tax=Stylosanthes scabra TaxID=79078 RepID=A0ABU6QTQ4_9FABA|nr:hypothetical protein [Stylosanthes scabra]